MNHNNQQKSRLLRIQCLIVLTTLFVASSITGVTGCKKQPPVAVPLKAPTKPPKSDTAPRIPFVNIAEESGVIFQSQSGAVGEKLLPESGGSGVAIYDYDNDGKSDILLLSGQAWPWDEARTQPKQSAVALYRNAGGDKFVDVTEQAGLELSFYAQGVAVGDYDSDGDQDLFLTGVGESHLLRNDSEVYIDVTTESGVDSHSDDWTTSCGFFDYDRDGDLDLFVCNYVEWSRELDTAAGYKIAGIGRAYAPPFNFAGTNSFLYRNDNGAFKDVSKEAGIHVNQPGTTDPVGKALAVVFLDFDRDSWLDIFVANDTVRNFLFRNRGDGSFEEVAVENGAAFDANGAATSAMGVDMAWIRNTDDIAVAVGNFANEMTSLFVAQAGQAVFTDESMACGVGGPTRSALSFGLLFDDFDLDGRVDLVQANGHLEQEINTVQPSQQYRQKAQLFWNAGDSGPREFVQLSADAVVDLATPVVGRAVASADLDRDGDLDLVITQINGPPLVLSNQQNLTNHWISVSVLDTKGPADGIGAIVEIEIDGVIQRRLITRTRSYLTQTEPTVTFGLGSSSKVDRMIVVWPDGVCQEFSPAGVDRHIRIERKADNYAELLSRAKALFELARYADAIKLLENAAEKRPQAAAPRRNLARCWLLAGDIDKAEQALDSIDSQDRSAAKPYLQGLIAMRRFNYSDAARFFKLAVQRRHDIGSVHFQLGKALLAEGAEDEAIAAFATTTKFDPLHGAAQFRLASLSRKRGEQDEYTRHYRDYQRIRELKGDLISDEVLLEACSLTEIETLSDPASSIDSGPPSFEKQTVNGLSHAVSDIAVLTVDQDGRYVFVAVSTTGEVSVGTLDDELSWVSLREAWPLPDLGESSVNQIAVANAIVDGGEAADLNELAVLSEDRIWLLRVSPDGRIEDLTESSGLDSAGGQSGLWCDVDHDGAIDWLVASDGSLAAWRNLGDGRFKKATVECKLGDCSADHLLAIDLQSDNIGVDLITISEGDVQLWENQLGGVFHKNKDLSWPAASIVLADEFDGDTDADVVLVSAQGLDLLGSRKADWVRAPHQTDEVRIGRSIDYDNDGQLDVALVTERDGRTQLELFSNHGGLLKLSPSASMEIDSQRLLDIDCDFDGRTDLLSIDSQGVLHVLKNQTPDAGNQLKLALYSFVGQPSSIGTRVQFRNGSKAVTRYTQRQLPIEIGIGDASRADVLQTVWNNGVVHNELDVNAEYAVHDVVIVDFIRTSSCPFLYVKDGDGWRFVTDILGGAPLNVAARRQVPIPPDSDEVVRLKAWGDTRDFEVSDVRVTTELREAVLLDELRLITAIHPRGSIVLPYDRIATNPIDGVHLALLDNIQPLDHAVANEGQDITESLSEIDGKTVLAGGALSSPAIGHTSPGSLVFTVPQLDDNLPRALVLTGWYRFGSSSTNVAASERADIVGEWPVLEVQQGGDWLEVDVEVGFPAGNTKTIICDLTDKIPMDANVFRLTTSLEVRWDAIHWGSLLPSDQLQIVESSSKSAELQWHGVSHLTATCPDGPQVPMPLSDSTMRLWTSNLPGWYTRYGDVQSLLRVSDERLALLASGDGVTVDFSQSGKLSPSDSETTHLLYVRGWIKEWDPNAAPAESLSPFPGSDSASEHGDWQLEYNTRWVPRL